MGCGDMIEGRSSWDKTDARLTLCEMPLFVANSLLLHILLHSLQTISPQHSLGKNSSVLWFPQSKQQTLWRLEPLKQNSQLLLQFIWPSHTSLTKFKTQTRERTCSSDMQQGQNLNLYTHIYILATCANTRGFAPATGPCYFSCVRSCCFSP